MKKQEKAKRAVTDRYPICKVCEHAHPLRAPHVWKKKR